ncbi:arsenate reductase family protein [Fulvivirga sedimenti]|uniref:Uncharacterized protein n=1 Tax=Fulvivirga sedimenti TaxID=2879465 RepID=A0A9X1HMN7_9BACT|nr:hypothetical protein [Fulvivirga sedimenti]MCA6073643.1 hypothetical protein [Fulvivirga sedimenti]
MTKGEQEMRLYYNSEKKKDREVLGYAQSLKKIVVNERDISKSNLTERQLKELADTIGEPVEEMMDRNDSLYMDKIANGSFTEEDLLMLMSQNPSLIDTPIAVVTDFAYPVASPFELIPKDLSIEGVKSRRANVFESSN